MQRFTFVISTLLAWVSARDASAGPRRREPAPPPPAFHAFGNDGRPFQACAGDEKGRSKALLIGINDYVFDKLQGSVNDVVALAEAIKTRGVETTVRLTDREATRPSVLSALDRLVADARCGDLVFIHYSGSGSRFNVGQSSETMLLTCEAKSWTNPRLDDGVAGSELVDAMIAMRNRGTFVFVTLDTSYAEGIDFRMMPLTTGLWRWAPTRTKQSERLTLSAGAAGFAAFFAADRETEAIEWPVGNQSYGAFSVALASALSNPAITTFRALAQSVAESIEAKNEDQRPVFEATDPDATPFRLPAKSRARIEVRNPMPIRGSITLAGSNLLLDGEVTPSDGLVEVIVNGDTAKLSGGGRFRYQKELPPGHHTVRVIAWFADSRAVQTEISVAVGSDVLLAQRGTRYALIIGNQNYAHRATFPVLETPIGDAKDVADVLRKRFGFTTEFKEESGATTQLVVLDGTEDAIMNAVETLRDRLRIEDTLLIFYAGHGWHDRQNNETYWIPIDGKPNRLSTWISSSDLMGQFKKMNALHILVISDSCFSGAMLRTPLMNLELPKSARATQLMQLDARRSRHLLSSGGDEPVLDGGGGGHSIFAGALLNELRRQTRPFTSQELAGELSRVVLGRADQAPAFQRFDQADDGGGVVFVPR